MTRALALVLVAVAASARGQAEGPAPPLALRGAWVFPVTAPPIRDGVVVVRDGRIEAVGPAGDVAVPEGATVLHEPEAWIVPGFVDLHDHVGGTDINEMVHPVNPDLRVLEQVVPGNEEMLEALAGGVTTVLFIPGSGTNMGGFGVLLKTAGRTLDEMVVRFPGALKIAQAGNPERYSGEVGRSRLGMNWNLRQALLEGQRYHEAWTAWEEGRSREKPARVVRLELLRGLFRKDFPVLVHTQWAPVHQATIRMLRDELGLWIIMSHSEFDSFHNAPLVVERGIPVNVGPRGYHVDYDTGELVGLAARFHEGGVERLSVNTDSPVVPQEELFLQAAMAVRYGLPWEKALRALTIEGATAIGIDRRAGSLEPGKDADVVLWTGDPLDPRSRVLVTVSSGRIALDQREGERRF
jgi:imidazolonepropionase-like amidohydrolase